MHVEQLCNTLSALAPIRLAQSWDNVGLLVGDRSANCSRVMTCLTITPAVVREAIQQRADVIVTHHPLPFKPVARLTRDTIAGGMLLDLMSHRIAVYSAHTAFDSSAGGINQQLAEGLGLTEIVPLIAAEDEEQSLGSGRCGTVNEALSCDQFARRVSDFLNISHARVVDAQSDTDTSNSDTSDTDTSNSDTSESKRVVRRVGIACGSGGSFLAAARRRGCDLMLTGEATFHTCLESQSSGITLLLVGHYASERFAMQWMAGELSDQHPELTTWASEGDTDPLRLWQR